MTPAEVASLVRIRQMRERRARAAAQEARRAEQEATVLRTAAEQAWAVFATAARQQRKTAHNWLEESGGMVALTLQSVAAELAGLHAQEAGLAVAVRRAATAEAGRRAGARTATRHHAAAQRGAEALGVLAAEMRASAAIAAERAEEAEAEEPRARP